MIDKGKKEVPIDEMFEARKYSDYELQDFHNKVQKFWSEPREVELKDGMFGIAQKFNHPELHVAFGAAIKVKHGLGCVYLYNERYKDFVNLWGQYESWRGKQDWIAGKNAEGYAQIASESQVPF